MNTLHDIPDLKGKRVLVRAGLNVPLDLDGNVFDDFRLQRALPTITFLRERGARVLLMGHIGRKEGDTLMPVYRYLLERIPELAFLDSFEGKEVHKHVENMHDGDIVLFENVRQNKGEWDNDESFSRTLADLADVYVNDAFGDSHRIHASIVGVPRLLPSYAGLLMEEEVRELSRMEHPEHPFLFILGGAKFETKFPLVQKFLTRADTLFIGGALANDVFRAQGHDVGASLLSKSHTNFSAILGSSRVLLPGDVRIVRRGEKKVTLPGFLEKADVIVDAGPDTIEVIKRYARTAKTILWNGPLGNYEGGHTDGTVALAQAMSEMNAHTIVGGGDTLASINKLNLYDKFDFVSTGGGAMLEFLASGTLVGIKALEESPSNT